MAFCFEIRKGIFLGSKIGQFKNLPYFCNVKQQNEIQYKKYLVVELS